MNRRRTRTTAAALILSMLFATPALAACAGIAEQAAEQAAGAALGGDVNVEDGGVTVTDESGNAIAIGENIDVPENWPAEVPLFEGGSMVSVSVNADGTAGAMWTTDTTAEEAAAAYDKTLTAAGYTQTETANMGGMIVTGYEGNGLTVSVSTITSDDQTTGVMLTVTPASSS